MGTAISNHLNRLNNKIGKKTPKPDLLEFFGGNESNDVQAVEIKIISLTTYRRQSK